MEGPSARRMLQLRTAARRLPSQLEGSQRSVVPSLLRSALRPGCVSLLEGSAGSGKSTAVRLACEGLSGDPLVAEVCGRELAHQEQWFVVLQSLVSVGAPRPPRAKAEGRLYLAWRLAELKRQGRLVVVVLHDCELCAAGLAKQSLLYALLDLMQDPDVGYALVLTTRTRDFVSKLEKRLESRLGSQRLAMPPLSVDDAEAVVRRVLTAVPVAGDADDEADAAAWNRRVAGLVLRPVVSELARVNCSDVRGFVNLAWLVLGYGCDVDAAHEHVLRDAWRARYEALSEVELCVLIVALRPSPAPPSSLDEAFDAYRRDLDAAALPVVPKKLFRRAYFSLLEVAPFALWPVDVLASVLDDEGRNFPTYLARFFRGFA